MKKNTQNILFIFFLLIVSKSSAQNLRYVVSGIIMEAYSKKKISQADINLFCQADSSKIIALTSNENGQFIIENIEKGNYYLLISFGGFEEKKLSFQLTSENQKIKFDSILLYPLSKLLKEVKIKNKSSYFFKNDTLQFNVDNYHVSPDAMAGDLLKKIPGFDISRNGSVTFNGIGVEKILLDGKPFLGNSGVGILNNIPFELIDKVQLINQHSIFAIKSGIEDGKRSQVVNITIKNSRKNSNFGTFFSSYGTQERYANGVSVNAFRGEDKINLTSKIYNTSTDPTIEYGDLNNEQGGISNSNLNSLNYDGTINKKMTLSVSSNYNNIDNSTKTSTLRTNFLDTTTSLYFLNSNYTTNNNNLDAAISIAYKIDSLSTLSINESLSVIKNSTVFIDSFTTTLPSLGKTINEGENKVFSSQKKRGIVTNIQFDRISPLAIGSNLKIQFNHSLLFDNSFSNYLFRGKFTPINQGNPYEELISQNKFGVNKVVNISLSILYTKPLSKSTFLDFSYDGSLAKNNLVNDIFMFNQNSNQYDIKNNQLSSNFLYKSLTHQLTSGCTFNLKSLTFYTGIVGQQVVFNAVSRYSDTNYKQKYFLLTPTSRISFNSGGKFLSVEYNKSISPPQPEEIIPVVDNSNPLYLRIGNPYLKNTVINNFTYRFNFTPKSTGIFLNAMGNTSIFKNKIVENIVTNLSSGKQVAQFVNSNGIWQAFLNLSLGFAPIYKKIYLVAIVSYGYNNDFSFFDGVKSKSSSTYFNFTPSIKIEINKKTSLNLKPSLSYTERFYSTQKLKQNYQTFSVYSNVHSIISNRINLNIDLNYMGLNKTTSILKKNVFIADMRLSYFLLHKKQLSFTIKVSNLFNQKVQNLRQLTENYFEDSRTNAFGSYCLFILKYQFIKRI